MSTYVTLQDAKEHLAIDDGLTIHDRRITIAIGAAEDWAENYTNRSLGELMQLDSPRDEDAVPLPTPSDPVSRWPEMYPQPDYLRLTPEQWTPANYRHYWAHVPPPTVRDHSMPQRRDIYAAILLYMETLFDRNTDNMKLLQTTATAMLDPYRQGLGV